MKISAIDSAFERALSAEIAASELLRVRVLAVTLAVLLVADELLFLFGRDLVEQFTQKPLPAWLPAQIIGPFLAYEIVALLVLHYRLARGSAFPTAARLANALIETSLPTVSLWWVNQFTTPAIAFGTWPTMLYIIFIVASTLRLDFVLPAFTGVVAAAGYLGVATWVLSFQGMATNPNHVIKAALMVVAGAVAGLVALRLRAKFRRAVEEAVSRERVTNLFGQHVSPAVVDRLLDNPSEFTGDIREICVMFLDIRNFTENARDRPPEAVVEFLNSTFAFMIEAIDRHGGFINKFPAWLPAQIIGPFLAYEIVALLVLHYRLARGSAFPTAARLANALIETSLPTVSLWWVNQFTTPAIAFGTWPTMLYIIFIVASTLRLDFVLPAFTGVVAAAGYLGVATWVLSFQGMATNPNHVIKAALMVVAGAVAGLVALRLRAKFRRAVEEAVSRERVTNLFGQHVSPAVVDRLLDNPSEFTGDIREICVMFLDIRNFTENARDRPPEAVVEFLNSTFAFMIEAIDRHGGFINKFLGDGFLAIFGAPLDDLAAAGHAVEAAREILTEIDERGLSHGSWPLKVGIGLHVGSAVTGNVGSPRRKEFTAIGDTVNLASRLEQLTKEYPARLIVSDSMMAALGATAGAARPLGKVAVRGYTEPVPIWGLD